MPTVVAPVNMTALTQAPVLPTASPLPSTPVPTAAPTQTVLTMLAYRHPSRVFALNVPEQWNVIDESTPQRIVVNLIPPAGYGSRVTIDVTNEGTLMPADVRELAESYIRLRYSERPGFIEVSRSELPDGRLQFVFLYDDHRGATGRETLTIQQVGPYFAAIQVFLSDRETASLAGTLDAIASSLAVDPLAGWGSTVAAINPAELQVGNSYLWRDRAGMSYYAGDLLNAAPSAIEAAVITVTFCDGSGIVVKELKLPTALTQIPQGGSSPFGLSVEGLPEGATICGEQAAAEPAHLDSSYTTALTLNAQVEYHQWRRDLTFDGPITNHSLVPVHRVKVILVVYDSENQIIGYAEIPLETEQQILPGQQVPFRQVIPALGGEPDHVVTLVQANVITQENHSLIPTPTAEP